MLYEASKIVISLYRTTRPIAAYVGKVSLSSRAYSTARSKGIALPSAQAFSNSSGLSISRTLVRSRSFKRRKTDHEIPAPVFSLRASATPKRRAARSSSRNGLISLHPCW